MHSTASATPSAASTSIALRGGSSESNWLSSSDAGMKWLALSVAKLTPVD